MAAIFQSAYTANVRMNSALVFAYEWTVAVDGGLWDATTFEGLGYQEFGPGVVGADISVRGFWNATVAENQFANPPALRAAYQNANLRLYPAGTAGVSWHFPKYRIAKVNMLAQVRDGIKLDFDSKSEGIFYYPGGFAARG